MAIHFPIRVRVLVVPVRIVSGVGVGKDGIRFVLGFVSLSPLVPLPVRKLAGAAWPPSGGYGYGNQLKNRTQDGFHSLQLPLQKKDFCLFLFILFGSWQKWSFLYLLEIHKARFLVKCATGGRQSNIAWAQRKCCACEIILLTISILASLLFWLARRRGSEYSRL